ncbi:MAG: hypothetical protein WBB89_09920 [Candidatus Acidiferrum sp.]
MVDRYARDLAAQTLREFIDGSISNREYERRCPKSKDDPALWSIYANIWFCYSDTSEHTLTGKHALTDEGRAIVGRCLLFLKSDLEFQWPATKLRLWYPLLRLIGLGRIVNRRVEKEMSVGDVDVWPFLKKAHYDQMSHQ